MPSIVDAAWVEEHDPVVIDVRDSWAYDGLGHLPNAVNVPFEEIRSDDRGAGDMLPERADWIARMRAAGLGTDRDLLAYDDDHGVFAARLLVTALLFGHPPDRLRLLDGDFSAWQRDRSVTDAVPDPAPTDYDPDPPETSPLIDRDGVREAVDGPAAIVDTRSREEYDEGHIPGAIHLDWRDLVDEDSRGVRAPDDILATLADLGIDPDGRIVLYCNTARRISHTYLVLDDLGIETVSFYEGSLTDWGAAGEPIVESSDRRSN
ncbi:MAG: sulfurtransferase [Halococcoides sp.]